MKPLRKLLLLSPLAIGLAGAACSDGGSSHGAKPDAGDAAAPDAARDATSADAAGETGVQLKVRSDHCPTVYPAAAPSDVPVGASIAVSATVDDPDADGLAFLWSARSGTFATAWAPSTEYTCREAGEQNLTVTVSDGQCNADATVPVTCH